MTAVGKATESSWEAGGWGGLLYWPLIICLYLLKIWHLYISIATIPGQGRMLKVSNTQQSEDREREREAEGCKAEPLALVWDWVGAE